MLLVVMGMGRSGTSVLMQVLEAAGFDCGADWIETNENNPRGYYERLPVMQFNRDILREACPEGDFIFPIPTREAIASLVGTYVPVQFPTHDYAVKDPRFSLTFPVWYPTITNHDTRIIIAKRSPNAIAESVLRAYGQSPEKTLPIIDEYNQRSQEYATEFGLPYVEIVYEDWFEHPAKNIERLETLTGRSIRINLDEVLDPKLRRCHGKSSLDELNEKSIFQKNWLTLQDEHPECAAWLKPYVTSLQIINIERDSSRVSVEFKLQETGETLQETLEFPQSTMPPYNRYSAYKSDRHWLFLFGFGAISSDALPTETLSSMSPIVVLETSPEKLIVALHREDISRILCYPSLFLFVGETALHSLIKALSSDLLPFFQTARQFHWIPASQYMKNLAILQEPLKAIQSEFQSCSRDVAQIENQAFESVSPNPSVERIAIVTPSVGCWNSIAEGIAKGFRDIGVATHEAAVSFPPSSMSVMETLQLRLDLLRFKPNALMTISHSSALFFRGLDEFHVPRIIWYVDYPDHLIQQPHHPLDRIVPCWKEFAPLLEDRGVPVFEEVPVGSVAIQTSKTASLESEILFVGSIKDTSPVLNALTASEREWIEQIVDQKVRSPQLSIEHILAGNPVDASPGTSIHSVLLRNMNRPGMNDRQRLHYFIHVESNRQRRIQLLSALHDFPLAIYGTADWGSVLRETSIAKAFRGKALSRPEYYSACCSSTITLNIHPCFPHSGPTIREFETVLCGGFLLSDFGVYAGKRLQEWFVPQEEIALYTDDHDIAERVEYFLSHPEERTAISKRAVERIQNEHTYTQRAARFKALLETQHA